MDHLSALWLAPLGIATAGAAAVGVLARKLSREVAALRQALRPLRLPTRATGNGPRRPTG